jgi:hypothetical protein
VGARFFAHVQTGPGSHPASCTMGTGSFPGVKRPRRGADQPPPSSAEVRKEFSYTSTPPLSLRACYGVPLTLPSNSPGVLNCLCRNISYQENQPAVLIHHVIKRHNIYSSFVKRNSRLPGLFRIWSKLFNPFDGRYLKHVRILPTSPLSKSFTNIRSF